MTLCAVLQPNSCATMSFERECLDASTGQQRQVLSLKRREKVAMNNTEAATILGIEIDVTGAVAYRRADIVGNLMPHVLASPEESRRQGIWLRHRLDMHGPLRAATAVSAVPRTGLNAYSPGTPRDGPPYS